MAPTQRLHPARNFYAVAHRAGNNLRDLEEALAAGVDAIECDFWHDHGRLTLRHERKLPALPVLYDGWYLRFGLGTLNLPELLRRINFRADLFLDIKSATPLAADAVLKLHRDYEAMMPAAMVSSKEWHLLDRLAAAETDMQMYYSVGRPPLVDALLRRLSTDPRPAGTSIRHTLLSRELVRRLHDEGLRVFAWTVNAEHRARELIDWGVDGIISDDVHLPALLAAPGGGSDAPPSP
ncbi:MAG: glycerophosphodiester phosphodiesterase [Chloroflexi bacterium]|nr:glycerophosphodiester phosphodiesterase [Chloroflexota bacterium]